MLAKHVEMSGSSALGKSLQDEKLAPSLRSLAILEEISKAGVPVSGADIQRALRLPKPTIYRLLQALEAEGYLTRDLDGKRYAPSQRSRRMAIDVLSSTRLRAARLEVLRKLSDEIGETCNIAVPDRNSMIYLDRYETSWPLRFELPIGSSVPLYCTASGKVFLSHLRAKQRQVTVEAMALTPHARNTIQSTELLAAEIMLTKRQGYAVDDEEFVDGMIAIGVPVYGPSRRLFRTLSFHAVKQRMPLQKVLTHVPLLKAAAERLSRLVAEA